MEISELTLKLILLLVPGAIATIIFEKLTTHKKWNSFQFVAHSILFGALSYVIAELLPPYSKNAFSNFWEHLSDDGIPFSEIIRALFTSIFVGFACSGIDHYKVINRIGKILKLTDKYGDESLYYYFLNSPSVTEVYIRDLSRKAIYQGVVESYSETDKISEIILRSVKVFDYDTAQFLFNLDSIYISKQKDDLIIEVP